jgi:hypothetical protein
MTKQVLFNINDLAQMDPLASAEKESGPESTFGKRDGYAAFVKQQNGLGSCNVTMYSLFTSFRIRRQDEQANKKYLPPPILQMDEYGFIISNRIIDLFCNEEQNCSPFEPSNSCE